jgi:cytochrome c-type biogenesis protein CcmH/NrfG
MEAREKMYEGEDRSKRWIPWIAVLLVPALAIVFWWTFSASDSQAPTAKSGEVGEVADGTAEPVESFEQRRIRVDNDPEFYESTAKKNPATPEDHYLLGRAYVLMGMKTSAKTSFDTAFKLLSERGIETDRALAADIVFGRTVAADDDSFIKFRKSFIEMTAKDREARRAKEEEEANKGL